MVTAANMVIGEQRARAKRVARPAYSMSVWFRTGGVLLSHVVLFSFFFTTQQSKLVLDLHLLGLVVFVIMLYEKLKWLSC